MREGDFSDLAAFLAVAEERSFTRAAARLGLSPSALSHSVRGLEERVGVRLLARTTRSVSVTEAGERLLRKLRPAFDEIDAELGALSSLRDRPAGTVRINSPKHAATELLWPAAARLLARYPDLRIEITIEDGFVDIVEGRHDAGIRLGEFLQKDMVAVRIGPDLATAVVASPAYLAAHPAPRTPHDLTAHACIQYRRPSLGAIYAWEFERDGDPLTVRTDGPLTVNDGDLMVQAALDGAGLAHLLDSQVAHHIAAGRLVRVLADWCPPFSGFHLYYPSRRQPTAAFTLVVNALRHRP